MHGLEYICKFHNLKYTELAEELGIKTQNITLWATNLRKIPKKHIDTLSKKFNIDEKYLCIGNLTELEKLKIEKILLKNELDKSTVEFEGDVFYDKNLPYDIKNTEDEIKKTELLETIKEQMSDSEEEHRSFNEENVKLYNKFSDLVINNKVNKTMLMNVLQAVDLALINRDDIESETDTDVFRAGLAKTIKKYDEVKRKQKEEFERLSKELLDTEM